jgi:hypothetical protein
MVFKGIIRDISSIFVFMEINAKMFGVERG